LEIDNPQPTECQRIRNEIDAAMIFTVGLRKRAPSGAKETRISIASAFGDARGPSHPANQSEPRGHYWREDGHFA